MAMPLGEIPLIITPDPDDPDCAVVRVDGTISGRPYRFVLDTGASRTQVVADDLTTPLPSHGPHDARGIFARRRDALVTVTDVAVGPLRVATLQVVRVDASRPGTDNLLAMDVLTRRCCHFRFDAGALLLGPSPAPGSLRPLRMDGRGHVYVDVRWPTVRGLACWDTGAGITVVDRAFLRAHPELFERCASSVGTDSTGAQVEAPTYWMAGPTIGGAVFARLKVAAVDLSVQNRTLDRRMDLILGYTALRQADWLFDFPARRWRVTRPPAGSSARVTRAPA
jgi:hypothetical protein